MIEIDLLELNKALGYLKPAATNRTVPGLDHLYFHEGKLSAFNGTTAVVVDFPTELECGIPHAGFIKTIASLTDQPKFEIKGNTLKVTAGRVRAHFPVADITPDTLIFHPPNDAKSLAELPVTSQFISGLGRVYLGSRDSKIEQAGINLFGTAQTLNIVTYDGVSCSRYITEIEKAPSLILPYAFCEAVMKTIDSMLSSPSRLYLLENFAVAQFGEKVKIYSTYFVAQPDKALFTNINQVLDEETPFSPIPKEFSDSLRRFASVLDESTMVKLEFSNGHLTLVADKGPTGMLEEEMDFGQPDLEGRATFPLEKLKNIQPYVNQMKLTNRCIIFKGIDERFCHAIAIKN